MMNNRRLPQNIKDYSVESIRAVVKIHLSILGPIGTAIDEVLFGIGDRIKGKRLEEFVQNLSEKINSIEEGNIDEEFLNSDSFYDLVVNILNSAIKTQSKEKHSILSSIFLDAINKKIQWEDSFTQIYISYVNELTINHISIFNYILININILLETSSYENLYLNFSKSNPAITIDKYEFRMYLRDLENKTLISFSKDINEYGSSGGYLAMESYEVPSAIIITSIGINFARFLSNA